MKITVGLSAVSIVLAACSPSHRPAAGAHVPDGGPGFPTSIGVPPPPEYRPHNAATKPAASEDSDAGLSSEADDLALPPSHRRCGLFGCISSPYLRARLGDAFTVSAAVATAGAPTSSVDVGSGRFLTWRRTQFFHGGILSCEETIAARGDRIVAYRFEGNC